MERKAMARFNIRGEQTLTIPEKGPILIKGWLITHPPYPIEDAVLSAVDTDGDIFTAHGMRVPIEAEYGGTNLEIIAYSPITVTLAGKNSAATIYYERLRWERIE